MNLRNFAFVSIALVCVLLSSCSSVDDAEITTAAAQCDGALSKVSDFDNDVAMETFFNNVNELNNKYARPAVYSNSSAISDLVDSAVGGLANNFRKTKRYSWLASAVASFLCDKLVEYLTNKDLESTTGTPTILPDGRLDTSSLGYLKFNVSKCTVFLADTTKQMSYEDSIGYYHNILLNRLEENGKSYIDKNGNIDYDGLYNAANSLIFKISGNIDISDIKNPLKPQSLGFNPDFTLDTLSVYDAMKKFTISFVRAINPVNGNNSFYDSFEIARGLSVDRINGVNKKDVDNIRDFCQQIKEGTAALSDTEYIEYGREINSLIEESNITEEQKSDFKVLNNIMVNSHLYWKLCK